MNPNKITLVSDYDGTITPEDIPSIKEFHKKHIFILATGRYFKAIEKEIKAYNIPFDFLICNNGAEIYNKNYELIYYKELNKEDVKIINNLNLKNIRYNYDYQNKHLISLNIYGQINITLSNSTIEIKPSKTKILPLNISKLKSVLFLEKNYHLKNIIAIGDDYNDLTLLEKYNGYKIKDSSIPISKEIPNLKTLIANLLKEEN